MMDGKQSPPNQPKSFKETMYDRIKVPIWVVDVIIWGCVGTVIFLLVHGAMQGNS